MLFMDSYDCCHPQLKRYKHFASPGTVRRCEVSACWYAALFGVRAVKISIEGLR